MRSFPTLDFVQSFPLTIRRTSSSDPQQSRRSSPRWLQRCREKTLIPKSKGAVNESQNPCSPWCGCNRSYHCGDRICDADSRPCIAILLSRPRFRRYQNSWCWPYLERPRVRSLTQNRGTGHHDESAQCLCCRWSQWLAFSSRHGHRDYHFWGHPVVRLELRGDRLQSRRLLDGGQ